MDSNAVALATIAILAITVPALLKILDYLLKRGDKTIEANTEMLARQINSTNNLAETGQQQAIAITALSKAVAGLQTSIVEQDRLGRENQREVMEQFRLINDKADRNFQAIESITTRNMKVEQMNVEHLDTKK